MKKYTKNNIPIELIEAAELIAEDKLKKAEPILRDYLKDDPLDVNAMKLLADIGIKFRAYKDAGYLLVRALDLSPEYDQARLSYANLLYKRQLPFEALEQISILLEKDKDNIQYLTLKAVNLALANQHDNALEIFEIIIKDKEVVNNQLHLSYGHTLRAVGRLDEAIESYKNAISTKVGYGEAYWSLANLKTFDFTETDINEIKSGFCSAIHPNMKKVAFVSNFSKIFKILVVFFTTLLSYLGHSFIPLKESTPRIWNQSSISKEIALVICLVFNY